MKTKALTSLLLFLILSLGINLSFVHAHAETSTEEIENNTAIVTDYFKKLRANCGFSAEEFEQMHDALLQTPAELINPVSKDQSFLRRSQCNVYWANFERIRKEVAQHPDKVDHSMMLSYLAEMIIKMQENEGRREEAHVDTKNLLIEMDFVTIPQERLEKQYFTEAIVESFTANQYQSVEIIATPAEVQIQTTPVTQYQWAKVMGDNHFHFKEGEDCYKVEIDGSKIQMCPNRPVESVSYQDVYKFIEKMNEKDPGYEYQIPSIQEYLAVAGEGQKTYGTSCQSQDETCHIYKSSYQYIGTKRIHSIPDNTIELTRDLLDKNSLPAFLQNEQPKIIFGTPHYLDQINIDDLSSMTMALYFESALDKNLGFRLIRHKKGSHPPLHLSYDIRWQENYLSADKNFFWDKTNKIYIHRLETTDLMFKYKEQFSQEIQHTVDTLVQEYGPLEKIKNTIDINLFDKNITDISPLAGLTNLQELWLQYNQIADINPLAGLTNLFLLYLNNNKIADINPLAGLTNLFFLYLNNNKIADINPLAGLTNLQELWLQYNQIADINPLVGLNQLVSLFLGANQVPDIKPLAGLNKLRWLELENNQISDINPLAGLNMLKKLYLHNNQISDINPLAGLNNLGYLYLENNQISDINPLAGLNTLWELHLNNNQISDISPLAGLNKLKDLYLYNNPVTSINKKTKRLLNPYYDRENRKTLSELKKQGCKIKK